eukprot:gene2214-2520_t
MLGHKEFQSFMHNKQNKDELIKRFNDFAEQPEARRLLEIPLTINHRKRTVKITTNYIGIKVECNHEEADTRVVMHAFNSEGPVVLKAKDTDILILIIYAFALKGQETMWCMQIDHNKYVNIGKIVQFLGVSVCLQLPAFHSVTGCDTTSYFYRTSKAQYLKKHEKTSLYTSLSHWAVQKVLDEEGADSVIKFIHETIYNGKPNDNLVTTRIKQYDKLRVKTTQSVIPDPESIRHLVKRANMAAYYLKAFSSLLSIKINPCESGWQ